ncbi:hypothetical protein MIMGU_mgv1a022363mg, partial [Erythranthe guttata]
MFLLSYISPYNVPFPNQCRSVSASHGSKNELLRNSNCNSNSNSTADQPINSTTVGNWLQRCSNVREIREVHAVVVKRLKDPLVFVDNNLISMYVKFGDLAAARKVFDDMSERNVVSWTAMLNGYHRHGIDYEALRLFIEMQERDVIAWTTMITACSQHGRGYDTFAMLSQMLYDGVDPNEFTVCSVLNACGEEKELIFGEQLHNIVIKKAYDLDVYVATSLVDLYAKCGKIEKSRTIFDGMRRKNAITWSTIIAGYARNGLGGEAISLFRTMKRLKMFANSLTMVSILRACGLIRSVSTGKEVHAQIFKNFSPSNIFVGSALVWLYCKCGDYVSASKVLEYLPDKDVVSWTAMISGCARLGSALVHMYSKCGHLSEAAQVFESMPERNLVSWKAMIVAYAKNGQCGEALKLVYRMQAEGIGVDDYILSTVLTACGDFNLKRFRGKKTEYDFVGTENEFRRAAQFFELGDLFDSVH